MYSTAMRSQLVEYQRNIAPLGARAGRTVTSIFGRRGTKPSNEFDVLRDHTQRMSVGHFDF